MSLADELLDGMVEENEVTTASGNIVIGNDRFITIPDSMKKIAVQYDHDVETVTFDCPRYWDGHDLSTMRIYVNYMRPDEVLGCHSCTDVTVDENDPNLMHFDWTVSGHATFASGSLAFLVCVKAVDEEGNETTHWNSELNTDLYISGGLECGESMVYKHPDIISHVLSRMDYIEVMLTESDAETILPYLAEVEAKVDTLAEPDKTLTISGTAADAKVVGDILSELSESNDAKIPNSEKGAANGVATLDENVQVPIAQIPALDYIPEDDRGAASGIATLDESGKLTEEQIPTDVLYMKEEILSDDTRGSLGMANTGSGSTPDTAFKSLINRSFKVGDILATSRKDLSASWLLCNGQYVPKSAYSKLWSYITNTGKLQLQYSSSLAVLDAFNNSIITCMHHANGYWVIGGRETDSSTNNAFIAYATNFRGTWTKTYLWSGSGSIIRDIIYADGYWVACGLAPNGIAQIAYRNSTAPSGTWTKQTIWSPYNNSYNAYGAYCITYNNGYWAVGGANYSMVGSSARHVATIAFTTNPSYAWTINNVWECGNHTKIESIHYANGYWVVGGIYNATYARIAITTDLSSTSWTFNDLWSTSNNSSERNAIDFISYVNDYWVLGGSYYSSTSSSTSTNTAVRYAYLSGSNPNNSWSMRTLQQNAGNIRCVTIASITHLNGVWMMCGTYHNTSKACIAVGISSSIMNLSFTDIRLFNATSNNNHRSCPKGVVYVNDTMYVVSARADDGSETERCGILYELAVGTPVITTDDHYYYIKAT